MPALQSAETYSRVPDVYRLGQIVMALRGWRDIEDDERKADEGPTACRVIGMTRAQHARAAPSFRAGADLEIRIAGATTHQQ